MPNRDDLLTAMQKAAGAHAAAAVHFTLTMWEGLGLGAADGRAYDLILRNGPLTAGEIAQATGLTSGSVTALIGRLESGGFVQRVRDGSDRRKVFVYADPARLAGRAPRMAAFSDTVAALNAAYTDAELEILAGWLRKAAALTEQVAES